MDEFLPFALPDIGQEEIDEVVEALRSGWLTTGPKSRQFETDFAHFLGGGVETVAVNSATAGLHLALEALGIGPGDEVITSPYTFTATAEVIRYMGADPVFVDIDPVTFNIDPLMIEAAITERTKAIIVVHFAGLACRMEPILALARKYGLEVIEDAAHAFPATSDGALIGRLETDATVFSFYATKTITTGEGGMLVTRNSELAERCRVMRLHGIDRHAFDRYRSTTPAWYYEVVYPGFKYNLTDLAAAIGIQQLRKAVRFREHRAAIAARYRDAFAGLPVTLPVDAEHGDMHAWHLFVLRLTPEAAIDRDRFITMMANHKIGCGVHFIPLHIHPYWRDRYHLDPDDFPAALAAWQAAVSLPIYTRMDDHAVGKVIAAVRTVLGC